MNNRRAIKTTLTSLLLVLNLAMTQAQCGACQYAVNLVTNGNFSGGNNGFTTSLTYSPGPIFFCPLCSENTYAIGANASLYHNNFTGNDHTNPPSGNFFIANGPGQANVNVWCQTFSVQPNTLYTFTFWARDVTNNSNPHPYAILQASFNGILDPLTVEANGGWEQYSTTWNSGTATTLQLCIVNQQSNTGGNDFGLDDISFTGCQNYQLAHAPNAGPDITLCSGEALTIGAPANTGYQYTWSASSFLNATNTANPLLQAVNSAFSDTTFSLIVTRDSANVGCIASDTLTVTVHPLPAFSLGNDPVICPGSSTPLSVASWWDAVLWSDGSSSDTIEVGAGVWSAEVTLGNCETSDEVVVTEWSLADIDFGEDQTICSNQPLVLNAGIIGNWNTGAISDTLLVDQTGLYSFTFSQDACQSSDSIFITVEPAPTLNLGADTTLCPGSELNLSLSGNWNSIVWQDGSASVSLTTSDTLIWVLAQSGACLVSDTLLIHVPALPEIDLGPDMSTCGIDSIPFSAPDVGLWNETLLDSVFFAYAGGEITFAYSVDGCTVRDTLLLTVTTPPMLSLVDSVVLCQGELTNLNAGQPGQWSTGFFGESIDVFAAGVYSIEVSDGPCVALDSTRVDLIPLPFLNLPESVTACDSEPHILNAESASNATYLWSTGEVTSTIQVEADGEFWVEAGNVCGVVRDTTNVLLEPCDYGIFAPSCFTPNDDPYNEGWVVQGYNVSDLEIIVYNRFGDAIFKAFDFGVPWFPSTGIKQDVYNYRIAATTYDGDRIVELGCIYLVR